MPHSTLGLVLVILLVLILIGGLSGGTVVPYWRYGYGYDHGGIGVIGVILLVIVILWLMGYM